MKIQQQNEDQKWQQHHKNLPRRSPKQSTIAGNFFIFDFKNMIIEALIILPLYLILFFIWWQFRHLIKAMTDVENILNDDDFLRDTADTQKKALAT